MSKQNHIIAIILLMVIIVTTVSSVAFALYQDHDQDSGKYTIVKSDVYLDESSGSAFSKHSLYIKSFGGHYISGHFVLITDSQKQLYVFFPLQTGIWYTYSFKDQNTYTAIARSYSLIEDEGSIDAYAQAIVP